MINKKLILFGITLAILILSPIILTQTSNAYDVFKPACDAANANNNPACKATGADVVTGNDGIVAKVTKIVAVISGIVAVIAIMLGGYKIIMSGGKPENVTAGREMVMYAAIGLVVVIIAQYIVSFAISRL